MKVVLLAVTSIDGKITLGSDPDIYKWTSKEDQEIYFSQIERAKLIIMGRKTYENAKHLMKPKNGRTRVVVTTSPDKYKEEASQGYLEFTSDSPKKILQKFQKKGIKTAILVGGAEMHNLFLKEGLVTEIHLTIEPLVFGKGKSMFSSEQLGFKVKLMNHQRLNSKGTILLKYKVVS